MVGGLRKESLIGSNMNANQLTKLISSLGMAHDCLVENGTLPDKPLELLFEGEDTLGLDLEPGLELIFGSETTWLEEITIYITDGSITQPMPLFSFKDLPAPYDLASDQVQVQRIFGPPFSSSEPYTVKGTLYRIGASDRYQVDAKLHANSWVDFHYSRTLETERIQFSIMERESNVTELAPLGNTD